MRAGNGGRGGKVTCVKTAGKAGRRPLAGPDRDAVPVLIKRLDPALPLPSRAHPGDAGADLFAAADVELAPGQRAVVPTGVAIALPDGYAAFVHPRSGLAAKYGVTIVNAPGTVDAGYRGEIRVTLLNTDAAIPVRFQRGDRIAQLVIQRVERAEFHEVDVLPGSARGDGGFGSTGGHAAAAGPVPVNPDNGRPGPAAR
jgi:dUTP pyrophosphatase